MSAFIAGFALLAVFLGAAFWFSRQKTEDATRLVRLLLGFGALVAGGVMILRGGAMLGAPLGLFGLGLVARAFGLPGPRAGGRAQGGPGHQPPPPAPSSMSVAEARDVLGVGPDATEADIRAAHKRLMKKLHPDTGEGSAALARQVQEARDLLLERLR